LYVQVCTACNAVAANNTRVRFFAARKRLMRVVQGCGAETEVGNSIASQQSVTATGCKGIWRNADTTCRCEKFRKSAFGVFQCSCFQAKLSLLEGAETDEVVAEQFVSSTRSELSNFDGESMEDDAATAATPVAAMTAKELHDNILYKVLLPMACVTILVTSLPQAAVTSAINFWNTAFAYCLESIGWRPRLRV
jgi:hypothetical protein